MIGIIGAMDIEVEGLISAMSDKEEKKNQWNSLSFRKNR